jgi:hypothetical protein
MAKRLKVTPSIVRDVPGHPVAAPCTISHCQYFALREDSDDADTVRQRLADLLSRTADALKGAPAPLHLHSWHDLPEIARGLKRALEVIYTMCRTDEKGEYWAIRKFLNDHDIYNENLSTPERLIEEVCKLVLKTDATSDRPTASG